MICRDGALRRSCAQSEGLRNVRCCRCSLSSGSANCWSGRHPSAAARLQCGGSGHAVEALGIFASGRATVATCQPESELARVLLGCGLAIPCEDIDALTDAIESLRKAPETRAQMGAGGRHYAEVHLATDAVLGRFNMDLAVLLERDAAPTSAAEPDGTAD